MEIIIRPDPSAVARAAAVRVSRSLSRTGRAPVLGVATGSSPLALYDELAGMVRRGELRLDGAHAFALDEYVGLPRGHAQSYAEVIRRTVTEPLGLDPARVHVPDGTAVDLQAAAAEFEAKIRSAGGVEVQILGIGANGHIGFNEPTSSLASRTRVKTLTPRTRADNRRFFEEGEEVPRHCVTQGLGTILEAREIVLVAQGAAKAKAIAAVAEGPVTARVPGSVLQLHPRVTLVIDEAAASELELADYYRFIDEQRPQGERVEETLPGRPAGAR